MHHYNAKNSRCNHLKNSTGYMEMMSNYYISKIVHGKKEYSSYVLSGYRASSHKIQLALTTDLTLKCVEAAHLHCDAQNRKASFISNAPVAGTPGDCWRDPEWQPSLKQRLQQKLPWRELMPGAFSWRDEHSTECKELTNGSVSNVFLWRSNNNVDNELTDRRQWVEDSWWQHFNTNVTSYKAEYKRLWNNTRQIQSNE